MEKINNANNNIQSFHFVAGPEQIRGIQLKLKKNAISGKSVVKNGKTHLFVDTTSLRIDQADLLQLLGLDWQFCSGCELCALDSAIKKAKRKHVIYPPMILLPTGSSIDQDAANILLSEHANCTHIAINAPIRYGDRVRRPEIEPLIGDFGQFVETEEPSKEDLNSAFWCTSVQNGIFQTWSPLYTMFSRGNVTEKKRVLDTFNSQVTIADSTVIDLYSGIGYFALPYAKQNPAIVYCWEINWWSVEGMLRAAKVNKIPCRAIFPGEIYQPRSDDKIVIFVEDNQNALKRIPNLNLRTVSHINMGLLPHAREAIPVALALADRSEISTAIHLHENVNSRDFESWKLEMAELLHRKSIHLELIKQFSPGVYHVCGDFH